MESTSQITIIPSSTNDRDDWCRLRQALWPDVDPDTLRDDASAMLAEPERFAVFLARSQAGEAVGLAEACRRQDWVNGTDGPPVGFLEGLYVAPEWRRCGVARKLVAAVEDWTRASGCRDLASDALLDNHQSHAMHRALGFIETERVVYFRKTLESPTEADSSPTPTK